MEHCREKKAAADRRGESGKAISILLLAGLALSIVLSMDIGIWALEGWCDVLSEGRLPVVTQVSCSRAVGAVAQGFSTVLIFPCSLCEECWQEAQHSAGSLWHPGSPISC